MNQSSHTTETSHSTSQSSFWRIIWNLHIPNKIKLFTWRACQNILPTKANLCHRHVLDNLIYEAFGLAPETTGHLFWDCHIAKETWKLSDILFDKHGLSYRDFMDFLWHLVFTQHVGTDILELTVTTAWSIWFSRNKTRLGATRQPPHEIMIKARFLFMEYQDAHLRPTLFKDATDNRWVPPVFPWYKVNVDAAIIRDHEGFVVAALSKRLPLPLGPLEAEGRPWMRLRSLHGM